MKTTRFAEADALYGDLARSDPVMVAKQAAARLKFQVQNLPPHSVGYANCSHVGI